MRDLHSQGSRADLIWQGLCGASESAYLVPRSCEVKAFTSSGGAHLSHPHPQRSFILAAHDSDAVFELCASVSLSLSQGRTLDSQSGTTDSKLQIPVANPG